MCGREEGARFGSAHVTGCIGAWHRREGERATWNLYFGVGAMGFGNARAKSQKHVETIDDDHAYPMLRRCIFALSRATRADIIRTLVCIGGEILLSVMGS